GNGRAPSAHWDGCRCVKSGVETGVAVPMAGSGTGAVVRRRTRMGRIPRILVALSVVRALGVLTPTKGQEANGIVTPASACEEFRADRSTGLTWSHEAGHDGDEAWTLEDCVEVWTQYSSTIIDIFVPRKPDADLWRKTASELRAEGSPCKLFSVAGGDGLGSTTLRHLATWIFAEEMGCDWITPDWGRRKVPKGDGQAVMYCHSVVTKDVLKSYKNATDAKTTQRCSIVDWLAYFQFGEV
ncbi:unnamed protein product, partial [Scytosiphon promiscuus]